jgi:acetyl esterase/lipase
MFPKFNIELLGVKSLLAALMATLACLLSGGVLSAAPVYPDDVRVERDVNYLGKDRVENADLYFPLNISRGGRLPAVLIIHGGGWNDGARDHPLQISIGAMLARNGYVAMSIDYKLSYGKFVVWPTNLYDCKNAVRWLRKNAGQLQIDPDRIGVIGESAGGHLASMVALTGATGDLEPSGPYPGISDRVSCCVDMYGVADVSTYEPRVSMLGKKAAEAPELYKIASPINYVCSNSPPFLILHGTADKLVLPRQSEVFDKVLTKFGVEHRMVWVPGAPHAFGLNLPQQDLRPLVLDFFNRHLKDQAPVAPFPQTEQSGAH